jgi:hypothetical protein
MRNHAPIIVRLQQPCPEKSLSLDRIMAAIILGCPKVAAEMLREHGADAVYLTEREIATLKSRERVLAAKETT